MKKLAQYFVQFVSALFKSMGIRACRFYPSCSCYAHLAFEEHSFFKAVYLTLHRILRCHPFSSGGYDPLPENKRSL